MVKNTDFNFENFTVAAIKAIDEIRSSGINGPNTPIESRINAFYRSLGLPAIRAKNTVLDPFNSGNLFELSEFAAGAAEQDILLNKLRIRELDFIKPLTDEEIEAFTTDKDYRLEENLIAENETNKRLRGVMLPMVVNGNVPIYPQSKRVAGAFNTDEDLIIDSNKYKRPLIETIISIRLKLQGVQNTEAQSNVNSDLAAEGVLDFNNIGESIASLLQVSTSNISDIIYEAINEISEAKKKLGNSVEIVPTVGNVAEQRPTIRESTDQTKAGKLEITRALQQEKDNIKKAALSVFEYDDTFAPDASSKRNLKDSVLGSILLDIVVPREENAEREVEELEKQENKEIDRLIRAYRTLDLVFGQFSGIAGTDILIVITAMFKVELRYLIGLLNDQAQERLLTLGIGAELVSGDVSMRDSLTALEDMVAVLYDIISSEVNQFKHSDKKRNQSRESQT